MVNVQEAQFLAAKFSLRPGYINAAATHPSEIFPSINKKICWCTAASKIPALSPTGLAAHVHVFNDVFQFAVQNVLVSLGLRAFRSGPYEA
jgi:hypothetical protein